MLIDDHPVVRSGIRQMLASDPRLEVVAEAGSVASALQILRADDFRVDVVVLDLNLPDQSGLVVLQDMQRRRPELPILILSIQPEEHIAVRMLKAGAKGFLNKEAAPEELISALQVLAQGRNYVSPALASWLALEVSGRRESLPHERLSHREYQVFCMLARGGSISEIAKALSRSPNTISTFRARILQKMGIEHNAGLTEYALRHNIVD